MVGTALCLAVTALSCRDNDIVGVDLRPPMRTVATVQCTVDVIEHRTICSRVDSIISPAGSRGAVFSTPFVVDISLSSESYTPADSTYSANVSVVNRTDLQLGTYDGTTVSGVKVFFANGPAVSTYRTVGDSAPPTQTHNNALGGDTGVVRVRNPDGYVNLSSTANQPYFLYNEIIDVEHTSSSKEWKWTVPPGVKSFRYTVKVFTPVLGEIAIPSGPGNGFNIPQDTVAAIYTNSNYVKEHPVMSGPYPRNIVLVSFGAGASQDQKQYAADLVNGTVVGGVGNVYYIVRIPDGTADQLWAAITKLRELPHVARAIPDISPSVGTFHKRKSAARR